MASLPRKVQIRLQCICRRIVERELVQELDCIRNADLHSGIKTEQTLEKKEYPHLTYHRHDIPVD